jgi:cell wall-associated NlpC family hydrolase
MPALPAISRGKQLAALFIAAVLALAGAVVIAGPADAMTKRERQLQNAVGVARHQKGDPYAYGADGPKRFDCSGLVQYSYGKAGIRMPRTSDAQADKARRIAKSNMQPGDLIVFHDGGDVYHVGIYTGHTDSGKRRILHSPSSGERVHSQGMWGGESWYAATMRR